MAAVNMVAGPAAVSEAGIVAGEIAMGDAAGPGVVAMAGVATSIVDDVMGAMAGFSGTGQRMIVDNSLGMNPQAVAGALNDAGFDARTVNQMFGSDPGDAAINTVADGVGAMVVTSDRGRDAMGGFGSNAITVPNRLQDPQSAVRIVEDGTN